MGISWIAKGRQPTSKKELKEQYLLKVNKCTLRSQIFKQLHQDNDTDALNSYWDWTTYLKYGWLGDIVICNTSLVMSSSEKASFRHSESRITFEVLNNPVF